MTTQDPERSDREELADPQPDKSKTGATDPPDAQQDSMSDALAENVQELGRGENPMTQGDDLGGEPEDGHRSEDGNADAFSPGRGDQPG